MDVGVVAIRALGSNYYLAISRKGELYGAVSSCPSPPLTREFTDEFRLFEST